MVGDDQVGPVRRLARLLDEALLAERAARGAQAVAVADADLTPLAVGVARGVVALAASPCPSPPSRPRTAARAPSCRARPRAPRSARPARRGRPRGSGAGRRSWTAPSARRTTCRPRGGWHRRPRPAGGCRARPADAGAPGSRSRPRPACRGAARAPGRPATCRCRCRPGRRGAGGRSGRRRPPRPSRSGPAAPARRARRRRPRAPRARTRSPRRAWRLARGWGATAPLHPIRGCGHPSGPAPPPAEEERY